MYTNLKTKIAKELNSGVIYKVNCNDCSATYVGQTQNYLRDRVNAHKRSIKNGSHETALSKHAVNTLHSFNFNEIKILEHEKNNKNRLIKEMIYIKQTPNKVNNNTDTDNLSGIYNGILSIPQVKYTK